MLNITEKALAALSETVKEKASSIRILVKGYGWGGPVFGIALDEQKDGDQVVMIEEHQFVIDSELVDLFKGFSVDYSDNWFGKGFTIRSQMGGSSC